MEPEHSLVHALVAVTLSYYARSDYPFMSFFTGSVMEIDIYWSFTTDMTTITVWFSFFYFFYDLFVEVQELVYHGKRSFADLFHAAMCCFVYGIGSIFGLAHIPLVMLSSMEISTIFLDLYIFSSKWYKKTFGTYKIYVKRLSFAFKVLFALSFTWVRIVMYSVWYVHMIPYCFKHAQQKHIPCSQLVDGSVWCIPLNQISLILLTSYFVLNLWWWILIVRKVLYSEKSKTNLKKC